MKAQVCEKWCEPDELVYKEVEDPSPKSKELLIQIKSIGVNFPDILLIQGKYQRRPERPFIPGVEISGVVESVGPDTSKFKVGDRIMAVCWLGGYAEKVVISENDAFSMPPSFSFEEAAGFNVTYQSSYFATVVRGKLQKGENLLVHSGAGGIGSAAIQIGKAVGAKVFATCGSSEKMEICKQLGADVVFNYVEDKTWNKKIRKEYGGADVVIDPVGGEILKNTLTCMNFEGRIVVVGFTSGSIADVPSNMLLLNNSSILGVYWNLYYENHREQINQAMNQMNTWINEGKLKTLVSKTFPLKDAPKALHWISQRKSFGKLILIP
jgi:NADPH2:quinone reductase